MEDSLWLSMSIQLTSGPGLRSVKPSAAQPYLTWSSHHTDQSASGARSQVAQPCRSHRQRRSPTDPQERGKGGEGPGAEQGGRGGQGGLGLGQEEDGGWAGDRPTQGARGQSLIRCWQALQQGMAAEASSWTHFSGGAGICNFFSCMCLCVFAMIGHKTSLPFTPSGIGHKTSLPFTKICAGG